MKHLIMMNDEDPKAPDYWGDPDYNIPDECDLNPLTRKERRLNSEK